MSSFEKRMEQWLYEQIASEKNPRRQELLQKGIGHGTKEFLSKIWYPAVGNFNDLYAKWEIRDFGNRYRYLEEEPEVIRQMTLSFVGKFVSISTSHSFSWIETETLRFARGVIRPFTLMNLPCT